MLDVLTVGETMGVFRAAQPMLTASSASVSIAGAEGNLAVGLARLGHDVCWTGRVGDDVLGRRIIRTYAAEGIDVSRVQVDHEAATGILVSEERLQGVFRVDYHRRGSAGSQLNAAAVVAAVRRGTRILHVTGITPALGEAAAESVHSAIQAAREAGSLVTVDVNYRARLWDESQASAALSDLVKQADIVVADAAELAIIARGSHDEERAYSLLEAGVRQVVLKQGAHGSTAYVPEGAHHAPAYPVNVVDSIGAGDAFVAGYLSGLIEGVSIDERLRRGNALGAFAVSVRGDWEGLPTKKEIPLVEQSIGEVLR